MAKTCVFSPVNLSLTHSKSFFIFSLFITKTTFLGLFYTPTNSTFQHFSLTSTAVVLPCLVVLFLPISIFLSCLRFPLSLSPHQAAISLSLSLSITLFQYASSPFFLLFYFFVFATLLSAWSLGGEKMWESKGKYIYIYIYILLFCYFL